MDDPVAPGRRAADPGRGATGRRADAGGCRRSRRGRRRPGRDRGQASVELVAGIPVLAIATLVALQLLVTGYSLTLADGAVEAGALAVAADRPAEPAVRAALPGWARDRIEVEVRGGRVIARLRPPSPLPAIGNALTVRSAAWARPPAGTGT